MQIRHKIEVFSSVSAVALAAICSPASAQESASAAPQSAASQGQAAAADASTLEQPEQGEVVVTGIRASQARGIDKKRRADSVVEAISAQDIGKLPDVTISDSLQRVPGVQIRREAGEGGAINVRGLPQVTTLLNGEEFIGANSITTVQPNFTDIPAPLFAGSTIYKSSPASLQQAGLSGTIDLQTRRPLDLKQGLTAAAGAEGQYGDRTKKYEPSVNGLLSYNSGRFGALVSAAYSKLTLSNSFRGFDAGGVSLRTEYGNATNAGEFAAGNYVGGYAAGRPTVNRGAAVRNSAGALLGYDVNGDGDANDAFITPQSHSTYVRETERDRLGVNGSLQFEVSDTLKLTADAFYTRQTQYTRSAGVILQGLTAREASFLPTASRDTGAIVNIAVSENGQNVLKPFHVNTVQAYTYDTPSIDSYSDNTRLKSESQNYNLQLDWKPTEKFRATVRGIYAKASRTSSNSFIQYNLTDGYQWSYLGVGNYPASLGGDRAFNPGGYRAYSSKTLVDYRDGALGFTFPGSLLTQFADPSRYALKSTSATGSQVDGDLWALRADANWAPNDNLNVKFGGRYAERTGEQRSFVYASPLYAGNRDNPQNPASGCLARYTAFDVLLNSTAGNACRVLDSSGVAYTAGYVRPASDATFSEGNKVYSLPVAGLPGVVIYDPKRLDDARAEQDRLYPGSVELVNPANSWRINLRQISGYAQVSGQTEVAGIPVSANGGLRVVNTRLVVNQNIVGGAQPYGNPGLNAGDVVTNRSFTDFLPSFNVAFDLTSKLKLRGAFSRNMTLLDFAQWGGGLNVTFNLDPTTNPPIFIARQASSGGNPDLNPWRSQNIEASLEYYTGQASLIALGAFKLSVSQFIVNSTVDRTDIPDQDGVIRRVVPTTTVVQGAGGSLKGIEASARQSLADYGVNGFFGGFGVDANYTFSDGKIGAPDLAGKAQPFQDNSKHQVNAALWFEKYGVQARVAYNYRSKRLASTNFGGTVGLAVYQRPTNYFDASIAYDITPNFSIYGQASNLTAETERYYLTWSDQIQNENIYERRFIAGVRAKF